MKKSKIISTVLETAKDLNISKVTIHQIEALNVAEIKRLSYSQIKRMRLQEKLSQAVFARILNVTLSTYQKWERGEIEPKGANLKLLRLAYDHGIDYILE